MPLRIKLPPKDKIIINGAVIENAGDSTTIVLHNKADILRRKEVMSEDDAITPARRIYYAFQCAYLFKDDRAQYLARGQEFLEDYLAAAPSAKELGEEIKGFIAEERFYEVLRATLKLVEHETERLIEVGAIPRPDQENEKA